jgi:hypothetical protein
MKALNRNTSSCFHFSKLLLNPWGNLWNVYGPYKSNDNFEKWKNVRNKMAGKETFLISRKFFF